MTTNSHKTMRTYDLLIAKCSQQPKHSTPCASFVQCTYYLDLDNNHASIG